MYSNTPTEVDNNIGICRLPQNKIYHILDSVNYECIFSELDTINDFIDFYKEKEDTISKLETFGYYGETTLLALYYENIDKRGNHRILSKNFQEKQLIIKDDLWKGIKYYEFQKQYYNFWKQKTQPKIKSYDEFPKI